MPGLYAVGAATGCLVLLCCLFSELAACNGHFPRAKVAATARHYALRHRQHSALLTYRLQYSTPQPSPPFQE